jgi:sortase B
MLMNRLRVLMILLLIGMLVTGGLLAYYAKGYYDDRKENDNLRAIAYGTGASSEAPGAGEAEADDNAGDSADEAQDAVQIDFAALRSINSDIVGWLWACGGAIDGPIVQTTDNSFYLDHRFDKTTGSVGCFFADAELDTAFEAPLTVVYGHNRKDGSMFHPLLNYKDEAYFSEFDYFKVYTEDEELTYKVFSARFDDNSQIYGEAYKEAAENPGDRELLKTFYEEALEKSLFEAEGAEGPGDIVILSTCEYSGNNNRMVIYGVLTERK